MKTQFYKILVVVFVTITIPFHLLSQTLNEEIKVKEITFTIPSRGEKIYEIEIPEGVKKIKAVISEHTEMVSMELLGPTNVVLSKNSTWSNMSNWEKPLNCSASIVNNDRQKPGIWKIKIIGAVHKGKIDKIKNISGKLKIVISDN